MAILKQMNEIKPRLVEYQSQNVAKVEDTSSFVENEISEGETDLSPVLERINSVEWLEPISECKQDDDVPASTAQEGQMPMFPLTTTLFSPESFSSASNPLPIYAAVQDIPLPGMEIPLQIFEPRYREMYDDILQGSKQFVVPFCHPYNKGQYCTYGLVYEIASMREVADETNGVIQYVCLHKVKHQPFRIQRILNPQVWQTAETYLRVEGHVLGSGDEKKTELSGDLDADLKPLEEFLETWDETSSHPLPSYCLRALRHSGLWGLVRVWCMYTQQELLEMQVGIAAEAQMLDKQNSTISIRPATLAKVQLPHRERLLSLQIESRLLVPSLLPLNVEERCQYLMEIIQKEKNHIASLKLDSGDSY